MFRLSAFVTAVKPIVFTGVLEQGNKKVATFSDEKGQPVYAREGEAVLGQYKLLDIGIQSGDSLSS